MFLSWIWITLYYGMPNVRVKNTYKYMLYICISPSSWYNAGVSYKYLSDLYIMPQIYLT